MIMRIGRQKVGWGFQPVHKGSKGLIAIIFGVMAATLTASAEDNTVQSVSGISQVVAGEVAVGLTGTNNTLLIDAGGSVTSYFGTIGREVTANHNRVEISGADSRWDNEFTFMVGDGGSHNMLTVSNGATLLTGSGLTTHETRIGDKPASRSNLVLVTGSDSSWLAMHEVWVGGHGSGNRLCIENEAIVRVSKDVYVGRNSGSSNNQIKVKSGTLTVTNQSGNATLYVGFNGSGELVLEQGEVAADALVIGSNAMVSGNGTLSGSVTNAGALHQSGGDLLIDGDLTLTSDADVALALGLVDQRPLQVTGDLQIDGGLGLELGPGLADGLTGAETMVLIESDGTLSGEFTDLADRSRLTLEGVGSFLVTYTASQVLLSEFLPEGQLPNPFFTYVRPAVAPLNWDLGVSGLTPGMTATLEQGSDLIHTNWVPVITFPVTSVDTNLTVSINGDVNSVVFRIRWLPPE